MAVPVRGGGGWGDFDLYKDNFNFKHVPLLPRSSLVSPWQHCALFPVAVETLCVRKLQASQYFGSSLWEHLTHSHKSYTPMQRKHYQLMLSWAKCISALHSLAHIVSQVVLEFHKFLLLFLYKF